MANLDPPLTATYRLQLNASCTFAHVRARLGYVSRLGVSHLYLSPILAARRGSIHGYDIVDPTRINPELGTETEFRALASELHASGMGMIVDIVPNHLAASSENKYWDDVLAHGERSRFARWFDIEWALPATGRRREQRKLVLAMLGDELDAVLERGELSVQLQERDAPRIAYFAQSFPLDPSSLPPELQLAHDDPEETGELAQLYSGTDGRERLRELLERQHYRLVFWRRGTTEINYRRFFDVNELAAIRVEDPAVFDETHALILGLVRDGTIDGLRVDHIDGLLDPAAYLARLRAATSPDVPILVEKILSEGEHLPAEWPVQGTTGYDFLNDVDDVFLDPDGALEIENLYRRMRRFGGTTFSDVARAGKSNALTEALRPDLDRVARTLAPIARDAGNPWRVSQLAAGLTDFIAALPVYRTYIAPDTPLAPADREVIDAAVRDATERSEVPDIVAFVANVLLGECPGVDDDARLRFCQRLQQLSGPAAAKGVEDTALYVYVPLTSRGEVGGGPDEVFDNEVGRLHRANQFRAEHWPLSLLATSTHDTKRSADVRARLAALTEVPREWDRAVRRWRRLNAKHRQTVGGRLAPDTNTEYLLYQVLLALWPPPRAGRRIDDLPDRAWRQAAAERVTQYALKAAREAKTRTSWLDPDPEYERALSEFVAAILEPHEDAPFLSDVARLVSRVAPIGASNSLSRIAVHLTSPGVPDIYQGDELWNFTLVDPDNRRDVDYEIRESLLRDLGTIGERPREPAGSAGGGVAHLFDNGLKLLMTHRLLHLRRSLPDLFRRGRYQRLSVRGACARHVIAFARAFDGRRSITIASRLPGELIASKGAGWWRDTTVTLPLDFAASEWSSVIIAERIPALPGELGVGNVLAKLPAAVLVN